MMVELIELEERCESGNTVTVYDTLESLVTDLPNYMNWILDNEPEKVLPSFESCTTVEDVNYLLKDFDYSWWDLGVNKIEWEVDNKRRWVDKVHQQTLSDKEYFEMLVRETESLSIPFESLFESDDQYEAVNEEDGIWGF